MLSLFKTRTPLQRALRGACAEMTEGSLAHETAEVHFCDGGGTGTPVLLIHGNSACKEVFEHQFDALRDAGFRPVAFDLPGHGRSSNARTSPEACYTISNYARIAKALIDHLSLDGPILVGWSLGGHVAIEYAGHGWAQRGVLITGTPPVGPGADGLEGAFLASEAGEVTGLEKPSPEQLQSYIQALYCTLESIPKFCSLAAERTDGRARTHMLNHWISGVDGCHQVTVMRGLRQPTCVIHGAQDAFVSREYLEAVPWGDSILRGAPIVMDGVGHSPFMEDPDGFNEYLIEFCKAAGDAS